MPLAPLLNSIPDTPPPSPSRLFVWLAVAVFGAILLGSAPPDRRGARLFLSAESLQAPTFAAGTPDGGLVVIDNSRRRVLRLAANGERRFLLPGGERGAGRVFYAHEAVIDERDALFVISYELDEHGYFLAREEILEFTGDGRLRRVVHALDVGEAGRGTPRIGLRPLALALTPRPGGGVDWLELEAEGLRAWSAPPDGPARAGRWYPAANPRMDVASAVFDFSASGPPAVVYVDKAGRIHRLPPDGAPTTLYRADAQSRRTPAGVPPVPWGVAVDPAGGVVFTDVVFREIRRLPADGGAPETLWSAENLLAASTAFREDIAERGINPAWPYFLRVWVGPDGRIVTAAENVVVSLPAGDGGGAEVIAGFGLSMRDRVWAWASGLGLFLLVGGALLAAGRFVRSGGMRRLPRGVAQALLLLLVMALTLAITLPVVMSRLTERENDLHHRQIRQLLHSMSRLLEGDRLENLNAADDYDGPEYRALRRTVDDLFLSPDADWNQSSYCALYRFRDDRIYAALYLNGEVGLFFPFSWDDTEIYRAAYEDGQTRVFESSDALGSWILGVTPLRDHRGEIVAVLEVGTDRHVRTLATRDLLRAALLDALTLLVVLVLTLFECIFAANLFRGGGRDGRETAARWPLPRGRRLLSPFFAVRPLAGLFFAAWSFPAVFITLRMKELYDPGAWPWLSRNMALALPLSAQLFCFALAVNGGVRVVARVGAGRTLRLGFLFSGLGLLAAGLADGMGPFVLTNAVLGLGGGLGFIGIRSLLTREADGVLRDAGFAHFYSGLTAGTYVGLTVGSALAGYLGYQATFFWAVAAMALAWLTARMGVWPRLPAVSGDGAAAAAAGDWRRGVLFLLRPAVLVFVLCHLFPVYVLGVFVGWYFPVFAEEAGLAVGDIGRLMLLYGLLVIYGGPWASTRLLPRFGAKRLLMSTQLLWCLSVMAFSQWPVLASALVVLAVFALSDAPGTAAENSYLMGLANAAGFPEERAAAFFETAGKLGETAGPPVFALALVLGPVHGFFVLGVTGLIALLLLALSGGTRSRKKP